MTILKKAPLFLPAFLLAVIVLLFAGRESEATVNTTTKSETFACDGADEDFDISFPFVGKDDLVVTKITVATGAESILTRGTHYTVTLPIGSTEGIVNTSIDPNSPYSSAFQIRVDRDMDFLQETSFRSQGRYSARTIEDTFDRVVMMIQEVEGGVGGSGGSAGDLDTHIAAADDHSVYFLLAGRSSGQIAYGGTAASETLRLAATSHATRGKTYIGPASNTTATFDENNKRLGIRTESPSTTLDVAGTGSFDSELTVGDGDAADVLTITPPAYIRGGGGAGVDVEIIPSTNAGTKGQFYVGNYGGTALLTVDDENNTVGINTETAATDFQVVGESMFGTGGGTDYEVYIDDQAVTVKSDETDGMLRVTMRDAAGTTANASGLTAYGPSHATKAEYLELYGERLSFVDDPASSEHSYITEETVYFDGALLSQVGTEDADVAETVTAAKCGITYFADTDNTVIQLQEITTAAADVGCEVTVVNTCAAAACKVNVSPHSNDGIEGSCVGIDGAGSATVVESSGTADKDWVNAKATAEKGDYVKVISAPDGADWYIVGCVGEWASEP